MPEEVQETEEMQETKADRLIREYGERVVDCTRNPCARTASAMEQARLNLSDYIHSKEFSTMLFERMAIPLKGE